MNAPHSATAPAPPELLAGIEAALSRGYARLRFARALEQRFQADTRAARIRHHTLFGLLGVLLFDAFLLSDRMLVPDVLEWATWMRLGVITPLALLALLALRFTGPFVRESLVSLAVVVMGSSLVAIMLRSHSPGASHYYVGLPVIVLFATIVQRVRFWHAAASLITLLTVVTLGLHAMPSIEAGVRQNVLLTLSATALMTLAALYSLEHDERRAYLLRLREECRARQDPLTRLPNRLALEEFLQHRMQLAASAPPTTTDVLLYLDLDHFKTVNDTCGHAVGDRLLREISVVVRAQLRPDDFMARLGGDEFAVIIIDADEATAHTIGENIIKAVQDYRLSHDQTTFAVAVSIGSVALDHERSRQMSDLMAYADVACYAAKHAGRARQYHYRHDDADIAQAHGTIDWGQRLRRALDQNRFRLYLQQIVNADGALEGHEALVRLEGDDGAMVPPGAFLPAAKRLGLMTAIDRWVTREAFSRLTKNPELPGYVSVNLVPSSLSDKQFSSWLLSALRDRPDLVGRLRFEITEVEKLQVASDELNLLDALRAMGFAIYLDDFGSGYASFELLKRLPVDGIKLDGTVVQDYMRDPVDQALVQAAVTLASRLQIKLVAEGVETVAVLDALRQLGVRNFQGYLFHKPEAWQQAARHERSNKKPAGLAPQRVSCEDSSSISAC